jgi:hypothetical protein
MTRATRSAGTQYVGLPGISAACAAAVQRMLQYGDRIVSAKVLSANQRHCLLLSIDEGDKVAVKSGFASGYGGEAPRTFAKVLQLLRSHGVELEEVTVDEAVLDRLDASALTERDLDAIETARPVRPHRLYDYTYDPRAPDDGPGLHWSSFPAIIPFAIVDRRIADLALRFQVEPTETLLLGFRRLEDLIRTRTKSEEHGAKLFAQAFQGEQAKLKWDGLQPSEATGRANLFTGAYMAHRNPRAHKELADTIHTLLSEFLVLNHLFVLEAGAIEAQHTKAAQ